MGENNEDRDDRSMLWLAVSGVIVFLIVLLGIWLAVTRPSGPHVAAPTTTTTSAALVVTPGSDCHVPDGPQALRAPTDVTWQLYRGFAEPTSPTAGPKTTAGAVSRCYAHSPGGALVASIQIAAHLTLSGNVSWEDVANAQLVPGPGRDAFISQARIAIAASPPGLPGHAPNQVAAYKFLDYSPTATVLAIVLRSDSGALLVTHVSLAWDGGDWKVVVQQDGSMGPPAAAVPSIAGYTEFQGA